MQKPKYSIGETVRVKSLEEIRRLNVNTDPKFIELPGSLQFIRDMYQYCGRKYTISEIAISPDGNSPRYLLDGTARWFFSEECLRPISKLRSVVVGRIKEE